MKKSISFQDEKRGERLNRVFKEIRAKESVNAKNIVKSSDSSSDASKKKQKKDKRNVRRRNQQKARTNLKKKKTKTNTTVSSSTSTFRLFLISRPTIENMPACLISRCTKIVVDEPIGLKARLGRAVESLDSSQFDALDQTSRSLAFAVCYTHCAMMERRRYGMFVRSLCFEY